MTLHYRQNTAHCETLFHVHLHWQYTDQYFKLSTLPMLYRPSEKKHNGFQGTKV